ncbi:MAG: hypothetical protein LBH12_06710 [Dysgonamonadaceae bacterium]|jgi:hypothetical protein|nr:hypothetical protein [Dysgonamonadaceae bacterium]
MNNLTPIDILKRRKTRLQVKADALTDILEENFMYLQDNAVSLLGESAVDVFISKMPPVVRSLLGKGHKISMSNAFSAYRISDLASGLLDMVPLFLRGGKGIIASLLIKQLKKVFLK